MEGLKKSKIYEDIDTGLEITCPVCKTKHRFIHRIVDKKIKHSTEATPWHMGGEEG